MPQSVSSSDDAQACIHNYKGCMLSEIEKDVCSYFPYKGIKWKTRKRCRALVPDAPRAVNNPEFSPNVALANQGVSLLSAFARRITITLLSSLWLEITPPARRKGNLKATYHSNADYSKIPTPSRWHSPFYFVSQEILFLPSIQYYSRIKG